MRALCVHEGTPHCMEKELGLIGGAGTQSTVMHKLDPPGRYWLFLPVVGLVG